MTGAQQLSRAGIVDYFEEICRGGPLEAVGRWRDEGFETFVGYLPTVVPVELLAAQGAVPVGLLQPLEPGVAERGDALLQSYVCNIARTLAGLDRDSDLSAFDLLVFPNTCDVIRNLQGIAACTFAGSSAFYLELPCDPQAPYARRLLRDSLTRLSETTASVSGQRLTCDKLAASIEMYGSTCVMLGRLTSLRCSAPDAVPAYELYLLKTAAFYMPIASYRRMLARYLQAVESSTCGMCQDRARVLLIGCCCEQPRGDFIKMVEQAASCIVWDDLGPTWPRLEPTPFDYPRNLDEYADWLLDLLARDIVRFQPGAKREELLVEVVRRSRADGVLICVPRFCDPIQLRVPTLAETLERHDIPYCCVSYASDWSELSTVRDQVQAFADRLRLWGTKV